MPFLNQCNFIGHAGHSAVSRTSKSADKTWAEFSIAVSTGTAQQNKTMWVTCMVFGKAQERALSISKGDPVYVSGRIDVYAYNGKKDNEARSSVNLLVNEFQVLKHKDKKESSIPEFDNADIGLDNIPF